MIITTKDKIKQAARSIFARKGYEGTTMNEIAEAVGINKASIYNHYKGKEDLFFAVYQELAREYEKLNEHVIKDSAHLEIPDRLQYIFEQQILYYYKEPESQSFWNQITLFTPPVLSQEFWADILEREKYFQEQMTEIFLEGMRQGIIRKNDPIRLMMSFRAMKEGLLNWMIAIPKAEESWAAEFWTDYWLGIKERSDSNEKHQGIQID